MKIIVKRNDQQPEVTIDLKDVNFTYAIRDAFKLALELEGFTKQKISDVFNEYEDAKCNLIENKKE
jgi:hypothetical protein